ncbi:CHAD domain-containing protein [Friedmanniella endophytica]|uniref:CHAD domain-containing protein n=1 Tax=Microlunatus kandeliicorticis TaxID=1759536 RepID=A0A7W3P6V1_9ACTN|nr:CHAD domain-containing protein [Microlunatus kandeliicorticis]MBA8795358.1 CHAD domain-containing protein [Microlunatus kandeliicorticis]
MSPKKSPDPRVLIGAYLAAQCTAVLDAEVPITAAAEARAAGRPTEPAVVVELVHDTRVALRRLRSTLRVFAAAFTEPERTLLLEEAGWYAESLGALRDLDVIDERVRAGLAALPPALRVGDPEARLEADLTERRAAHLGALAGVLETERYAGLRSMLTGWRERPPWARKARKVDLRSRVKAADRKLTGRVATAVTAVRADDPEAAHLLHQARKTAKRHRYAAELAQPVLGAKTEALLVARKQLQDELGLLQDAVVTVAYLADLGRRLGNRAGRNVFSFGAVAALEQRAETDGMRRFADRG